MTTDHFSYKVTWSGEDDEFVATCIEFPSLSWLDSDRGLALEGLNKLIVEVIADLEANGEPVPVPLSDRTFSGKFNVRIPPALHGDLAARAAEEGVSLNRLVSDRLARSL